MHRRLGWLRPQSRRWPERAGSIDWHGDGPASSGPDPARADVGRTRLRACAPRRVRRGAPARAAAAARCSRATPIAWTAWCATSRPPPARRRRCRSWSARSAAMVAGRCACTRTSTSSSSTRGPIGRGGGARHQCAAAAALGPPPDGRTARPRARRLRRDRERTTRSCCWRCSTSASWPATRALFEQLVARLDGERRRAHATAIAAAARADRRPPRPVQRTHLSARTGRQGGARRLRDIEAVAAAAASCGPSVFHGELAAAGRARRATREDFLFRVRSMLARADRPRRQPADARAAGSRRRVDGLRRRLARSSASRR